MPNQIMPYVVETSVGLDRMFLAFASLKEETLEDGSTRTVLKLPSGSHKAAVLPLVKKTGCRK
jgi:glycyl-tRNA synthetase